MTTEQKEPRKPVTLEQVREALNTIPKAERELARLRTYKRLTPGMRDDRHRWASRLNEAEIIRSEFLFGNYVLLTTEEHEALVKTKETGL